MATTAAIHDCVELTNRFNNLWVLLQLTWPYLIVMGNYGPIAWTPKHRFVFQIVQIELDGCTTACVYILYTRECFVVRVGSSLFGDWSCLLFLHCCMTQWHSSQSQHILNFGLYITVIAVTSYCCCSYQSVGVCAGVVYYNQYSVEQIRKRYFFFTTVTDPAHLSFDGGLSGGVGNEIPPLCYMQ